jgi:hypothetical protein
LLYIKVIIGLFRNEILARFFYINISEVSLSKASE